MSVTSIKILVGDKVIGAVEALSFDDCCPIAITSSREIIEKDPYPRIQTSRMRFDKLRVAECFSRGFVNANSRRMPFNIQVNEHQKITFIENAWIESNSVGQTYTTADWIITQDVSLLAETIHESKK